MLAVWDNDPHENKQQLLTEFAAKCCDFFTLFNHQKTRQNSLYLQSTAGKQNTAELKRPNTNSNSKQWHIVRDLLLGGPLLQMQWHSISPAWLVSTDNHSWQQKSEVHKICLTNDVNVAEMRWGTGTTFTILPFTIDYKAFVLLWVRSVLCPICLRELTCWTVNLLERISGNAVTFYKTKAWW